MAGLTREERIRRNQELISQGLQPKYHVAVDSATLREQSRKDHYKIKLEQEKQREKEALKKYKEEQRIKNIQKKEELKKQKIFEKEQEKLKSKQEKEEKIKRLNQIQKSKISVSRIEALEIIQKRERELEQLSKKQNSYITQFQTNSEAVQILVNKTSREKTKLEKQSFEYSDNEKEQRAFVSGGNYVFKRIKRIIELAESLRNSSDDILLSVKNCIKENEIQKDIHQVTF